MKIFKIYVISILLMIIFSLGCLDSDNENKDINDDKNPNFEYKTDIIGSWSKNDTFENSSFVIKYEFFENNTFISGVLNDNLITYNISVNGTYIIDNETLKFTVYGDNPSTSTHKYLISEDKNFLLIYYEDENNFDVYSRIIEGEIG